MNAFMAEVQLPVLEIINRFRFALHSLWVLVARYSPVSKRVLPQKPSCPGGLKPLKAHQPTFPESASGFLPISWGASEARSFPMRRLLLATAVALSLSVSCGPSTAQDEEPPKEEAPVVITATRIVQPKTTVSSKVTVIEKKEIERSGARTVAELLRSRGAADMRTYGPVGSLALPSLRGATAEQILVMVDGRPINPPQGGGADLTDISLQNVERVEIVHGAVSAQYGSAAVGGVINIITSGPTKTARTVIRNELGSFGSRMFELSTSDTASEIGYSLSFWNTHSSGNFPFKHPSGEIRKRSNAWFEQTGVRTRIQLQKDGRSTTAFDVDWSTGIKGVPGLVYMPSPRARQEDSISALSMVYETAPSRPTSFRARLYTQEQKRWYRNPDAFPAPQSSYQRTNSFGLEASARSRHESGVFSYGFEGRWSRLNSNTVGNRPYIVLALFAQEQWRLGRLTVVPAARWDSTRRLGSQVSPHIGFLYRPSESVALRANVGRAFRTPSLNDLYWPSDPFALGNPNLRPEKAVAADLGVYAQSRSGFSGSVTWFRSSVRDLIVWQPDALQRGKWSPVNVGRAVSTGIEAEASYRRRNLTVGINATVSNPRDRTPGSPAYGKYLIGRAVGVASLRLGYEFKPWVVEARINRTGRRYESPDNAVSLNPYTTVDLLIERTFRSVTASLYLLNATNRRYEAVRGYPMPGRSVLFRIRSLL